MDRIRLAFPGGREKALTLSYDDGVDTDIRLVELMEKYGIRGTFNLNSGLFSPENAERAGNQTFFRLSEKKARELYSRPSCEVATHGYTHPHFRELPLDLVKREMMQDRETLEELFGGIIRGHAYPSGEYTDEIVEVLKEAGIKYARTVESHHTFRLPEDWMRMGATCRHRDPMLPELTDTFVHERVGALEDGWLFYLWGHTFEFRQDNNWNIIEAFFEKVSGRREIWYATNGEVYEYVEAWRNLVFSADGTRVYNPTASDVWIKVADPTRQTAGTIFVPSGGKIRIG